MDKVPHRSSSSRPMGIEELKVKGQFDNLYDRCKKDPYITRISKSRILQSEQSRQPDASIFAELGNPPDECYIELQDITDDPEVRQKLRRMKTILTMPNYITYFQKMTDELRSNMDGIISKLIINKREHGAERTAAAYLQESIHGEMDRLKKYIGSDAVDAFVEYLLIHVHLQMECGINIHRMNKYMTAIFGPEG